MIDGRLFLGPMWKPLVHIHANKHSLHTCMCHVSAHVYREEEQPANGDASGSMILLRDYEEPCGHPQSSLPLCRRI